MTTPNDTISNATMETMRRFFEERPYLATREGFSETTSERFAGISTADALQPLAEAGYQIAKIEAKSYRTPERRPYVTHALRLDHPDFIRRGGEYKPQIILKNANDGTAAFTLLAGLYRFACANGVVVGATATAIRVRHVGDREELAAKILAGTLAIREALPRLDACVEAWRSRELDSAERSNFFHLAAVARWGKAEALRRSNLSETAAYITRRREDEGNDLWRTFNRAQESFTSGTVGWARRGIRALRNIDASTRLNRTLWNIAEATSRGRLGLLHSASYHQDADVHTTARELALAS
jgi:hypothetical protein